VCTVWIMLPDRQHSPQILRSLRKIKVEYFLDLIVPECIICVNEIAYHKKELNMIVLLTGFIAVMLYTIIHSYQHSDAGHKQELLYTNLAS